MTLDEKTHTFLTYFRHASQIGFQQRERIIRTCYGQTSTIPLFFKGNGLFSFDYDFVDVNTRKKLLDTVHVEKVDSYSIETPSQLIGKHTRLYYQMPKIDLVVMQCIPIRMPQ